MDVLQILSHVLSAYTIGSCVFLKVPQINNARKKQTTEGLHLQPLIMEVSSYTVTGIYNYTQGHALLTWLEYPIIIVQVYVLIYYYLLFSFKLHDERVIFCIAMYFATALGFIIDIIPQWMLGWMVPFCTPVGNMAKAVYVMKMHSEQSAANVSLATWVISFTTNISRLFTVWMDSNDKKLMLNFAVSSTMSLAVLCTAAYYQYTKKDKPAKRDSKDEAANPDAEDKSTNTDGKESTNDAKVTNTFNESTTDSQDKARRRKNNHVD